MVAQEECLKSITESGEKPALGGNAGTDGTDPNFSAAKLSERPLRPQGFLGGCLSWFLVSCPVSGNVRSVAEISLLFSLSLFPLSGSFGVTHLQI